MRAETRAQTPVDFAVGTSLFLIVVIAVFGFLPSMFGPFVQESNADAMVTDRSAARLAEDLLVGDPARPAVLNESCTEEFFDADGAAPETCRYDEDGADLPAALGIAGWSNVNVTIRDGDTGTIHDIGGTELAAGPDVPESADAIASRRLVLLGGEERQLYVRAW